MRTLYQFPLSPYCEKVRWVLDFKELHFVAQNLTPGIHRALTQLKTKQNQLPVLKDGNSWIADSTQIAMYLDDIYPEYRIVSPYPDLHTQILHWNKFSEELGEHIRRYYLATYLENVSQYSFSSFDSLLGERSYARKLEKLTKPLLFKMLKRQYAINEYSVQQSEYRMRQMIQEIEQYLQPNQTFLVGDELSLADMAIASMIAPLLQLPETPWELTNDDAQHITPQIQAFKAYQQQLFSEKTGQYVKNLYEYHRRAWVDWRGV